MNNIFMIVQILVLQRLIHVCNLICTWPSVKFLNFTLPIFIWSGIHNNMFVGNPDSGLNVPCRKPKNEILCPSKCSELPLLVHLSKLDAKKTEFRRAFISVFLRPSDRYALAQFEFSLYKILLNSLNLMNLSGICVQ